MKRDIDRYCRSVPPCGFCLHNSVQFTSIPTVWCFLRNVLSFVTSFFTSESREGRRRNGFHQFYSVIGKGVEGMFRKSQVFLGHSELMQRTGVPRTVCIQYSNLYFFRFFGFIPDYWGLFDIIASFLLFSTLFYSFPPFSTILHHSPPFSTILHHSPLFSPFSIQYKSITN